MTGGEAKLLGLELRAAALAAKPFQRPTKNIVYGFNITPGW